MQQYVTGPEKQTA